MPIDPHAHHAAAPGAPARRAFSIVPGSPLPWIPAAIYVGSGGDVALRSIDSDDDVVYRNLPDGSYITVRAAIVRAAGTTASNLIGEV